MAEPEKRENSVLFSLRELQKIEEDRVSEEEAATRAAEEAKIRAQMEAERAKREAEEAERRRIEDEERRKVEEAERLRREEQMRLQEAETRARIQAQAAIEQQRVQQELEIRRVEASKKRPTTLIAIAGVLVVLVGLLIYWVVQKQAAEEKARKEAAAKAEEADKERKAKEEEAERRRKAEERAKKQEKLLAELQTEMTAAQNAFDKAQNDADRRKARDRLNKLKGRYEKIRQWRIKKKQNEGFKVSDDCKNNPLCAK